MLPIHAILASSLIFKQLTRRHLSRKTCLTTTNLRAGIWNWGFLSWSSLSHEEAFSERRGCGEGVERPRGWGVMRELRDQESRAAALRLHWI
ncbi:hypothetical protein PanWU01x14_262850 [Parasponia andersonii]|uniref:Uncharacterized protein n=1 Tax=Parasponia andersonii TaxID=3476 RepID=A0A2P5B7Z3_PARAD|nr:hypothetical protein PanWU01x14_262850 [Parasponia andersonii]